MRVWKERRKVVPLASTQSGVVGGVDSASSDQTMNIERHDGDADEVLTDGSHSRSPSPPSSATEVASEWSESDMDTRELTLETAEDVALGSGDEWSDGDTRDDESGDDEGRSEESGDEDT
jgi:hypothetical protein